MDAESIAEITSKVRELLEHLQLHTYKPAVNHTYDLAGEIYELYRNRQFLSEEVKEFLVILSQPHIRAVFDVHDRVANKQYLPVLPDILPQCDDEDTPIKIVKLIKNNEPLGVTIKKRENDGVIYVARVFVGGPAERSGLIQAGDEVHEVNGIPVKGRCIEQVVQILNSCDGVIILKLVPVPTCSDIPNSPVMMKAYFTYDPSNDPLMPCKAAGLAFKAGDILEILNTDDPTWWQARQNSDSTNRTGLIPSRALQTKRELENFHSSAGRGFPSSPSVNRKLVTYSHSSSNITNDTGSLLSPRLQRKLKKSKKAAVHHAVIKDGFIEFSTVGEELDAQAFSIGKKIIYEDVSYYLPPSDYKRPIIIVGPSGVGITDLRTKLLKENTDFATPLPVTSRPRKILETDGKEYSFISKHALEKLINSQRMLEFGEYKGHIYGITLDSIIDVISSGKTCLLTCQAQSLATVKCAAIKPYIIFIKSPCLEKLKQLKIYTGEKSSKKITTSDMEDMILSSASMESCYGDLFDEVVINHDFYQTYKYLIKVCHQVNTEAKWIPSHWLET